MKGAPRSLSCVRPSPLPGQAPGMTQDRECSQLLPKQPLLQPPEELGTSPESHRPGPGVGGAATDMGAEPSFRGAGHPTGLSSVEVQPMPCVGSCLQRARLPAAVGRVGGAVVDREGDPHQH